jgi:hypothetical protein
VRRLPGRLESAASHASPLVKPGQTMQPACALRLQPTLCPWMKRSGRLLSSDSQSLNRSSKWTRPSERAPMWRRSPGSSTGVQLQSKARNSLARAVFFNRLGEIRDRSFEKPTLPSQRAKSRCRCHYALEHGLSRTGCRGAGKISACRSIPVSARLPTRLGARKLNRRLHLAH